MVSRIRVVRKLCLRGMKQEVRQGSEGVTVSVMVLVTPGFVVQQQDEEGSGI